MIDITSPLQCSSEVVIGDFADFSVPPTGEPECQRHPAADPVFSSSKRGGARPNSGGPRANSGGPRPNSGGARLNSGPKPQPKPAPVIVIDPIPRWAVVAFWGQAEMSGTGELTRLGYETYLAMVAIRRRDPVILSMWHTVRVPLLSGYGFIRITQIQSREPILATRGVREVLLRPDGRPWWVPDGEIDKLRANDVARLKPPPRHGSALAVGTVVRIVDGAFTDHRGVVVECDGARTLVEVQMFGRPMPVWLDRAAVEAV